MDQIDAPGQETSQTRDARQRNGALVVYDCMAGKVSRTVELQPVSVGRAEDVGKPRREAVGAIPTFEDRKNLRIAYVGFQTSDLFDDLAVNRAVVSARQ